MPAIGGYRFFIAGAARSYQLNLIGLAPTALVKRWF